MRFLRKRERERKDNDNNNNTNNWLAVWNIFLFFHNIWDVILPIDELHHLSRWLSHPQPDIYFIYIYIFVPDGKTTTNHRYPIPIGSMVLVYMLTVQCNLAVAWKGHQLHLFTQYPAQPIRQAIQVPRQYPMVAVGRSARDGGTTDIYGYIYIYVYINII